MQIRAHVLTAALSALLSGAGGLTGLAEEERGREPAFQGHSAEMQMRTPEAEQRRRALYFDAVEAEIGEPGLPCDHLVRRRPDAVAGTGYVVLVAGATSGRMLVRVWFAPGAAASAEAASEQALTLAAARLGGQAGRIVDQTSFAWCR